MGITLTREETPVSTAPERTTTAAPPDEARVRLVLRVLTASAFVVILNETLMLNALPPLMDAFGVDAGAGQWLTTGFMLTMAVVIPTTGWLLQRLSLRTAYLLAMGVFIAGTALAAAAPTFEVLLLARVVQASGTAVMMPLLMTTIMTLVPPERRGGVMGNLTLAISVAPAMGPPVSGLILEFASWRWLFGLVLPIAVLMTVAGGRLLRGDEPGRAARLDVPSALLTAVGFGGLVYGLSALGEGAAGPVGPAWSLGVGVAALAVFAWRQLRLARTDESLVFLDLRALRITRYVVPLALLCLGFMSLIGAMLLLPILLQQVRGFGTLASGLMLMPGGLAMGLLGPTVGRVYDRVGPRPLVIPGGAGLVAGMAGMALLADQVPWWGLVGLHVVVSLSLACLFTPCFTTGLSSLPGRLYSHGSAMVGTGQQVAAAAGTALVVTVMETRAFQLGASGLGEREALEGGIGTALLVATGIAVGVFVLSVFVRPAPKDADGPEERPAEQGGDVAATGTAYPEPVA
ncbi:DHA2 family efflux MFS transporter permease subunit [Serinicoccus chungangensis]|uniref:DHA2 family efflux MFS transporter permease subunit n=1 Tax=Serinicoccus chungangensis TaxID=767452 RepID=UPI0009FA08A2|nr:DHA2 family efflux MFS transporter permease subunit [Serinicoccus chungangensis]